MVKKCSVAAVIAIAVFLTAGFLEARSTSKDSPYLKAYQVSSEQVEAIAKIIEALFPNVLVNEDVKMGRLHVHAPANVQTEVDRVIQRLVKVGQPGIGPKANIENLESKDAIRVLHAQIVELQERVRMLEKLHGTGRIVPIKPDTFLFPTDQMYRRFENSARRLR